MRSEGSYQQNGKSAYDWEKIFANNISHNRLISKIYKELVYSKKKKKKGRMARGYEWTFFQRSHISGQQANEKILSITNDQGNANSKR